MWSLITEVSVLILTLAQGKHKQELIWNICKIQLRNKFSLSDFRFAWLVLVKLGWSGHSGILLWKGRLACEPINVFMWPRYNGGLKWYIYLHSFSIDPTKGHIEMSLKGTDVGGPDPAPKPKRMEDKEREEKEKKERRKKRKKGEEASDAADDEDEKILKSLKTGK